MVRYHATNGNVRVQFTAEEEAARDAEEKAWSDGAKDRKLEQIKSIRLIKLKDTDYMANSDYTMPDNIKTWRQNLRDLPQDNNTEEKYDLLLARDSDGKLTHSVWTQPTS
jgi:hypothetical protein|tara:strand:+ start:609 stop:938 length:330 start_codon:yes stop_codon:yes gene_type:complete